MKRLTKKIEIIICMTLENIYMFLMVPRKISAPFEISSADYKDVCASDLAPVSTSESSYGPSAE